MSIFVNCNFVGFMQIFYNLHEGLVHHLLRKLFAKSRFLKFTAVFPDKVFNHPYALQCRGVYSGSLFRGNRHDDSIYCIKLYNFLNCQSFFNNLPYKSNPKNTPAKKARSKEQSPKNHPKTYTKKNNPQSPVFSSQNPEFHLHIGVLQHPFSQTMIISIEGEIVAYRASVWTIFSGF